MDNKDAGWGAGRLPWFAGVARRIGTATAAEELLRLVRELAADASHVSRAVLVEQMIALAQLLPAPALPAVLEWLAALSKEEPRASLPAIVAGIARLVQSRRLGSRAPQTRRRDGADERSRSCGVIGVALDSSVGPGSRRPLRTAHAPAANVDHAARGQVVAPSPGGARTVHGCRRSDRPCLARWPRRHRGAALTHRPTAIPFHLLGSADLRPVW